MGTESFKDLGVDPFREYQPSELDRLVSKRREELEESASKSQVAIKKIEIREAIESLPQARKDLSDPAVRAKAQEEVMALVTAGMQQRLFHRLDGTDAFFIEQADEILEPAIRKGWTLSEDVVRSIKGAKAVSMSDFKDIPADGAFKVIALMGTDDIPGWINGAIDSLYAPDSPGIPAKVSDSTSYPTMSDTVRTLATRAQKHQKNPHFKDAEKYSAIFKKLTPMFVTEKAFTVFRTAAVMYSVESELQRSAPTMDYQAILRLVNDRIAGRGIDADSALKELERFCLSKGIVADFSKVVRDYAVCGFCSCRFVIDGETNFCPYCNKPVAVECPRCGVRNSSSSIHCKGCGIDFSFIAGMPTVEKGLREDIDRGNLRSVKAVLPKLEGYRSFADPALLDEARAFVKDTEDLLSDLGKLEASKSYYSAVRRCDRYLRMHPGMEDAVSRRAEYAAIVEDVDRRLAGSAGGSAYIELVSVCSDHPRLLEYFRENRPDPPASASASRSSDGNILIDMGAPPKDGATYLIVRKAWSSPLNENDGETVAETKDSRHVDRSMDYGVEYRYAVYSKRWGVLSKSAALSGPVTVFSEASDVSASPAKEGVRLEFSPPRGCSRTLVFRSEDSEPSGSGMPYADCGLKGSMIDKEALDGSVTYYYRVCAEYSEGRTVPYRTPGRVVRCRPRPPPEPVTDLTVEPSGKGFVARFTSSEEAELFLSGPEDDLSMKTCSLSDLGRMAKRIDGVVRALDGSCSFSLPPGTSGRVYAVVVSSASAVIGNGAPVSTLADVSDIRTAMDGDVCSLTFAWPPGCDMVKAAMRSDRPPSDPSDGESDAVIMRERYLRDGNCRLKVPYQRTYLRLFCMYGSAGASGGADLVLSSRGDLPEIRYAFNRSLFGRSCTCKISVSDGIRVLPPMILRGSERSMPLKSTLGQTLVEIPEQELRGVNLAVPVPSPARNMKLFFADPEDNRRYRLIHPL